MCCPACITATPPGRPAASSQPQSWVVRSLLAGTLAELVGLEDFGAAVVPGLVVLHAVLPVLLMLQRGLVGVEVPWCCCHELHRDMPRGQVGQGLTGATGWAEASRGGDGGRAEGPRHLTCGTWGLIGFPSSSSCTTGQQINVRLKVQAGTSTHAVRQAQAQRVGGGRAGGTNLWRCQTSLPRLLQLPLPAPLLCARHAASLALNPALQDTECASGEARAGSPRCADD